MAAGGGRNFNFKVVLLGEGCVGKTSCVLRYVENKFNDKHLTTLQVMVSFTYNIEFYLSFEILIPSLLWKYVLKHLQICYFKMHCHLNFDWISDTDLSASLFIMLAIAMVLCFLLFSLWHYYYTVVELTVSFIDFFTQTCSSCAW